jgi:hypothetical protein
MDLNITVRVSELRIQKLNNARSAETKHKFCLIRCQFVAFNCIDGIHVMKYYTLTGTNLQKKVEIKNSLAKVNAS